MEILYNDVLCTRVYIFNAFWFDLMGDFSFFRHSDSSKYLANVIFSVVHTVMMLLKMHFHNL